MTKAPLRARLALPGDPATPTGGYVYDRRLMGAAPGAGLDLSLLPLPGGFPTPCGATLAAALGILRAAADADPSPIFIDGLAMGVMPAEALAALPVPVIALHHHPLGMEPGLAPERAAALIASETAALAACAAVLTTSHETAKTLTGRLGVPPEKIAVALPGLDRAPAAPRRGTPPHILGVGTISARKGWDVLARALAQLADLPWTAEIIGPRDREPAADAALQGLIEELGLSPRLRLSGPQPAEALRDAYQGADAFCLPSRYEGFGMVAAEAMAHALPVVTTTAGALPEATGGAALLVPPDDAEALAGALRRVLTDRAEADRMAAASAARAAALPTWEDAARIAAGLIARVTRTEDAA
ncbi:glycosyltransferase family 4 protein [Rhodovulum sp. DZ06]|uniref:glycosyltransferase family 4 protein n=1 Tax=Rhodovulum sp. DZ06 TaxID=3425126 RepID=UPI003D32AD0B